ncbi:restriction endonuclease subunit S [Campylobacter coli]
MAISIHIMYDGEFLIWNTDGLAGYIKIVNGKFSITNIVGIMLPLENFNKENFHLPYLKYYLEPIFRANIKGRQGINGANEYTKLNSTMIKNLNIQIPIPTKPNGDFDLAKQIEIADKYKQVDEIKYQLIEKIKNITSVSISF